MERANKNSKVVTSCRSRFHIFDQARELQNQHQLFLLITDYPKFIAKKFGIQSSVVKSLIFRGIAYKILMKIRKFINPKYQKEIDKFIHNNFSKKLANCIPVDTRFFIGLSSFCLEALRECKRREILTAVDHGSLHQMDERRYVIEEAERWDLKVPQDIASDWLIDKENEECSAADFIFSPSIVARESLVRNGIRKDKIFVNPYGVDLASFSPGIKSDNTFRIIQVGGITIGKGILTLVKAFSIANIPNSELIFIGGGDQDSKLSQISHKICSRGVTFLPPVPQVELSQYYNQSSIFVLASVADGYGMVVPQAMACGLPVIVTANVGASHLILDCTNGFIVPAGNPELMAMRILDLYIDPKLRRSQGANARETVVNIGSWRDYGDRLHKFIDSKVRNEL
jgi:glycosyltransferase involved in cell wall biosynthesis